MDNRQTALDRLLREKREDILRLAESFGVSDVRVFGSVARGEAGPDSDIDFLIAPNPTWTLFDRIRFKHALEDLLGREIDLVTEPTLHWRIRDRILDEAVAL